MASAVADSYSAVSGATLYAGRTSGVPAWVTTLAATPRRWAKLGNGMKAIEMRFNPAMNPLYDASGLVAPPWAMSNWNIEGICAWSAGAKHPTEPYFLRWGGGHGDSGYNGIPKLDFGIDVPTFSHLQWGDGTVGHWDGIDPLGNDARDGTYDDYASTGNPRSAHTYNGVVIAPNGIMYCTQGYLAGAAGTHGRTLWGYNLSTLSWSAISPLPSSGNTIRDFCHVPTLGGALGSLVGISAGNTGMTYYDISAGTWSVTSTYTNTDDGARMVYIPEPWDCVIGINYMVGSGFFVHDLGRTTPPGSNEYRPSATGTRPYSVAGDDLRTGVWIDSIGAVVGWKWGANLWTLTPPVSGNPLDSWTWGEIAADAGNTVTPLGRAGSQDPAVFGSFFHHRFGSVDTVGLSILDASGNSAIQPYFMVL